MVSYFNSIWSLLLHDHKKIDLEICVWQYTTHTHTLWQFKLLLTFLMQSGENHEETLPTVFHPLKLIQMIGVDFPMASTVLLKYRFRLFQVYISVQYSLAHTLHVHFCIFVCPWMWSDRQFFSSTQATVLITWLTTAVIVVPSRIGQ